MISILVAVYNVENYLHRCIDSILAQTYTDYEIILLNDGSTDGSGAICDAYGAKHDFIKVIHQKNGGVSQVRNALVAAAQGDYLTFVDSDDTLEPTFLQRLLQDLQETGSDIAICSWSEVSQEGERSELTWDQKDKGLQVWDREQAVNTMLYQKGIDNNMWGKLYARSVLTDVVFPVGKTYEDIAVAYQIFLKAARVCYRPEALYLYTTNITGISQSVFTAKRMDLIDNVEAMYADVAKRFPDYQPAARSRLLRAYIHVYLQIPGGTDFKVYRSRVSAGIRENCFTVAKDPEAKRGTRMAALIACVHPVLLRWLSRWKVFAK